MTFRATPIHAIELNGLKGWGFSVFMDREGGANEQPETANEAVERRTSEGSPQGEAEDAGVTGGESAAPHSEQARFPSQGALEADPVGFLLQAGSADQFNDTGPHVFSDQEPVQ